MAKLSRISRTALIYYDRIGLVTPVMRGGITIGITPTAR
ncbi:MAG: hypothetical protein LBU26_03465 [Synergistaceae bacterium]|nr:hypothetical protein [Synergistaceae bacterium]